MLSLGVCWDSPAVFSSQYPAPHQPRKIWSPRFFPLFFPGGGAVSPFCTPLGIVQKGSGRVPGCPPRRGRPLHPPRSAPPGALLIATCGVIPPLAPQPEPSVGGNNGKLCGQHTSAYFRVIAFSRISRIFCIISTYFFELTAYFSPPPQRTMRSAFSRMFLHHHPFRHISFPPHISHIFPMNQSQVF